MALVAEESIHAETSTQDSLSERARAPFATGGTDEEEAAGAAVVAALPFFFLWFCVSWLLLLWWQLSV